MNLINSSLEDIPEKTRLQSRHKASRAYKKRVTNKESPNISNNLKDIEKRILLKMKLNNKTDRKNENLVTPSIKKEVRVSRYLQSSGSDKPDNSFPKLANSSMTSAYSSPYGKHTDKDVDMRTNLNKDNIKDAMSRIKKSIARSQSIRNTDLSKGPDSNDYPQNLRENPYDNPDTMQYPEVYKTSGSRSKIDLQSIKSNMSKLFEKNKSTLGANKRYEIDTADSTDSSGYKFLKKSPSKKLYSDGKLKLGELSSLFIQN